MKKILILFIIILFSQKCVFADDKLIWDYKKDDFINEVITGKETAEEIEKQRKLDEELSQNLDIEIVYTNLCECLKIAVDNNFAIKTKVSEKRETYWNYKNANSQFLPDFNYSFDIQRYAGTFLVGGIVTDDVNETAITSNINLLWSTVKQGKLFFLKAQRKHNYLAADSKKEFTKDEIVLKTTLAYYDLLKQKMQFEVFKSNLADRNEQLRLTKARFQVGLGDKFDVLRAEAQVAQARQTYIASFNRLRLTQAKLANLMGINVLTAIYPSETTVEPRSLLDDKYTIEQLYQMALLTRDDVRAAKQQIEATKAERSSNYMDFVPKLDIYYSNGHQGTIRLGVYPNNTIGATVVVPLGQNLGVGTMTTVKAYNARIEAEQNKLTELTRNVKESIIGSYYDSKTALERLDAAKKEVTAADQSARIAFVRVKVGQSTLLDLLQAQTTKITAREALIETVIDYNKAQAQLLFDSGIISVGSVLKDYKMPAKTSLPP